MHEEGSCTHDGPPRGTRAAAHLQLSRPSSHPPLLLSAAPAPRTAPQVRILNYTKSGRPFWNMFTVAPMSGEQPSGGPCLWCVLPRKGWGHSGWAGVEGPIGWGPPRWQGGHSGWLRNRCPSAVFLKRKFGEFASWCPPALPPAPRCPPRLGPGHALLCGRASGCDGGRRGGRPHAGVEQDHVRGGHAAQAGRADGQPDQQRAAGDGGAGGGCAGRACGLC